ncbi:NAD-binding protein, partial [Stomatobaculum sp.]
MNIIVVGNGKIGELLVQQLSKEGHDVVVVDSNAARIRSLEEKLDVSTVVGNGASIEILREAGAENCDILIAVSNSDEVNLLTALVAKKLGCEYTVARVRSPEYDREMNLLKTSFGINLSVNPEKTCAKEIFRLLQFPSFLTRNSFAGGRAEMVELI